MNNEQRIEIHSQDNEEDDEENEDTNSDTRSKNETSALSGTVYGIFELSASEPYISRAKARSFNSNIDTGSGETNNLSPPPF